MKLIAVLALVILVGCAGRPTLEELEAEAIVSGDWSAVEARERMIRRRDQKLGRLCPDGYTTVCYGPEMNAECVCVRPQSSVFMR